MRQSILGSAISAVVLLATVVPASAAPVVTLTTQQTYNISQPFGLAIAPNSNVLYYTTFSDNLIHKLNTITGANLGTIPNPSNVPLSALGITPTGQIVSASGTTVFFRDPVTGALIRTVTSPVNLGFVDGLDYDNGQIYASPDVGPLYRFTDPGLPSGSAGVFVGTNPIPASPMSGYSGIERIDVPGASFYIVVNDNFNPRHLTILDLNGATLGDTILANSRFEDLAFDGKSLFAADLVGGRIQRLDVQVDGVSIFQPTPEPATLAVFGLMGAAGFGYVRRRLKGAPVAV